MNTLKNKRSTVLTALMIILWVTLAACAADMWAETPNPESERQDHGVKIDGDHRFVNNFNPKMYAETPGLNDILPGTQPETNQSS